MLSKPLAVPRPVARLVDRLKRRREHDAKAKRFRDAVWERAEGFCEACGVPCLRTTELHPRQGHVDHIRPRSLAKLDRTNPNNGQLLCAICHGRKHGRIQ